MEKLIKTKDRVKKHGEVFTPEHIVKDMIALIDDSVWGDKEYIALEPTCGNGNFVVEIIKKKVSCGLSLYEALNTTFGMDIAKDNIDECRERLFRICLESLKTRKSLVDHLCVIFNNIFVVEDSLSFMKNGEFDRKKFFLEEDFVPKSNKIIVIGNPPYQVSNDKVGDTTHASALYHMFVETIIDNINPVYFTMITPSRWMIGGRGLGAHRDRMVKDRSVKKIVHFPGNQDVFKGVSITGGVNYFLRDREYNGKCEFVIDESSTMRYLDDYDIVVQDNFAISILSKVKCLHQPTMNKIWAGQTPFGIVTSFCDWKTSGTPCVKSGRDVRLIDSKDYTDKYSIKSRWKVLTSKANGAAQEDTGSGKKVISDAFTVEPDTICTQTYIVVNVFDSMLESDNFVKYMKTKFFRFMLGLRVLTMDINKDKFSWVPDQEDYTIEYTDEMLYKKYNLSEEEIAHIEHKIKKI